MSAPDGALDRTEALARADELLAGQDFPAARAAFEELLAGDEGAAALEGLGAACRPMGDIAASVRALERAYLLRVEADERAEAAQDACQLADIELTELGGSAMASGWLSRARRHLHDDPQHRLHVVVDALSAYRALAYEKDPDTARAFAERSLAHARRTGDTASEVMAMAFLGCTEVFLGNLRDGFALLDEAAAAALAGELPPLADLDVYCVLITACERVRDFDRADRWAQRVLSLATTTGSDGFAVFARTQYAALLIWRGRWREAEEILDRILVDAEGRPMTAAMAMVLRASLRRRQGRLDEALAELSVAQREPYRRAVRHLVLAARARIELDRDDAQAAADLAERYLHAVSPSDLIERIDALETVTRARVALGELEAADAAAGALEAAADRVPTDAVRAAVCATRAEVLRATGRLDEARSALDQALVLLDAAGLVPDATSARVVLAAVLLELGHVGSARTVALAAHAAALELGAAGELAAASRILARSRDAGAVSGITAREVEILRLVAQGLTNPEIAARLVLSPRTVERHVSNIYLKVGASGPSARTLAVAHARSVGLIA